MTHRGGAREAAATRWGVRRGTAFLSIFLLAMFGLVGTPSFAEHKDDHNPGGNGNGNIGTVKVNDPDEGGPGHSDPLGDGGTPGTPSNDPHIGCTFDIEWFQYLGGETSTVTMELQSPTKKDRTMVVTGAQSGIVLGAPGENGLNHTESYSLSFSGLPHPVHGYHVKITVDTPHSQGSDSKHKVFWVEGCEDEPEGPTDECEELDGNQPEGTICEMSPITETRDDTTVDCETETATTVFEERTKTFEFNPETNEWETDGFSDWEVVDTDERPTTAEECPPEGPTDECEELDGNQPEGTICLPPANAEQRDDTSLDCPTDTVTTVFEERTEEFEFNFETNEWDSTGFSDWEVVDTQTRPANNQECPPEIEGEEDEIPGKDSPNEPNPVEVAGEQAAVTPPAAPPATAPTSVPTSVNAGLGETVAGQSGRSPLGLLMVMFGALLTAAAASRRRARA